MSMVSPEYYIEEITKDKTYKELIKIREEFFASFESFEDEYVYNPDANWETNFCPSPEVRYQVNMKCLAILLKVMQDRIREEYLKTMNRKEVLNMTNSNSKSVVNSVVEYIESLPEGSSTTTFKILSKLYGEESAWNMDPFSLHFEISDEIERRGKVELDLSEYDGLIVGLPQNYTFVVRKR